MRMKRRRPEYRLPSRGPAGIRSQRLDHGVCEVVHDDVGQLHGDEDTNRQRQGTGEGEQAQEHGEDQAAIAHRPARERPWAKVAYAEGRDQRTKPAGRLEKPVGPGIPARSCTAHAAGAS